MLIVRQLSYIQVCTVALHAKIFQKPLTELGMKGYCTNLNVTEYPENYWYFFVAFLINRQQRVVLNGKNSSWLKVTSGVPQGSVLDPLFSLVYINDLVEGVHNDQKLFADDISIFPIVRDKMKLLRALIGIWKECNYGRGNGRCSLTVTKRKR